MNELPFPEHPLSPVCKLVYWSGGEAERACVCSGFRADACVVLHGRMRVRRHYKALPPPSLPSIAPHSEFNQQGTMAKAAASKRASKRKAEVEEEAPPAPQAEEQPVREVRRRVEKKEKEELQPIQHESHSKVRRHVDGLPPSPPPRPCQSPQTSLKCPLTRTQSPPGTADHRRWRARCSCLATATAASWVWGRTSRSG